MEKEDLDLFLVNKPKVEALKPQDSVENLICGDISTLTSTSDGSLNDGNIGSVLEKLRSHVEKGVSLKEDGLKIYDSIKEAVPPALTRTMEVDVVFKNQEIPREKRLFGNSCFYDEKLKKLFDADAYDAVVKLYKDLYGSSANVKLIRYAGELVVVTDQKCGEKLRIVQVMDSDFPIAESDMNAGDLRQPDGIARKKTYIPVRHLLIQDTVTDKVFDARSLLPDDWSLEYAPDVSWGKFSQSVSHKHLRYSELISPTKIAGFAHEHGHNLYTINDDPELAKEAEKLWVESRFTSGGVQALPPDVHQRTKKLLIANERGASAHGAQLLRMLKERGIDLGLSAEELVNFFDKALVNYERLYRGDNTSFIRESKYREFLERVAEPPGPNKFEEIPTAFDDLAKEITTEIVNGLPEGVPHISCSFEIHPMVGKQYSIDDRVLGHGGEADLTHSKIHLNIEPVDIIRKAMSENRATYSDNKTMQRYSFLLESFLKEYADQNQGLPDLQRDLIELKEELNGSLNFKRYWLLNDPSDDVPDSLKKSFIDQVLLPTMSENHTCMRLLRKDAREIFTHEYGHLIFSQISKHDSLLSQKEIEDAVKYYSEVWGTTGLGSTAKDLFKKLLSVEKDSVEDKQLEQQFIDLNHRIVERIALGFDPELQKRVLLFAKLYGLGENFSRAFNRIITGTKDLYGHDLAIYAKEWFIYMQGGDDQVDKFVDEINKRGFTDLTQILNEKVNQAMKI
jgi:hypothetical protein